MINKQNDYVLKCAKNRIKELKREIANNQKELSILEGCLDGTLEGAYLTTVCMDDKPLVLFVGDKVFTKYGERVTIESFDVEKETINFVEPDPRASLFSDNEKYSLGDHRISYVIKRANKDLSNKEEEEYYDKMD